MTVQKLQLNPSRQQLASLVTLPTDEAPGKIVNVPAVVTGEKGGPLTWKDKIKNYYKAAIALVGSLVILLAQVQPLTPFLPDQYRGWITVVAAFLSAIGVFLTENQKWVDAL